MKDVALHSLETLINRTLALDPEAKAQVAELSGSTVALDITDWKIKLVMELTEGGIKIQKTEPEDIDATISGPLLGILQTACAGGDPATMRQTGLRMEGDIQLAEKLKRILSGLDLDWEEPLSRLLGPTAAGGLGSGIRHMRSLTKDLLKSGANQLATFLKTDSGCLPSEAEILHFNRAVTVLRFDADRLEARFNKLTSEPGESR
jgi:ubiquinone biosynthesis accessory factor UbiJ